MGTTITSTDAAAPWLPFLLQTADALFPTGAYAHSLGFEECVRLDLARDEPSLLTYLSLHLIPALREQELPYLRFAYEPLTTSQPEPKTLECGGLPPLWTSTAESLAALDHEISAWKLATETRTASLQLGQRRLKALRTISASPILAEYERLIQTGAAEGHHLIVCALQAHVGRIPLGDALTAYGYQSLAAICAAAMKLIRIGQEACQRVLAEAASLIPAAVESSLHIPRETAGWFDPLLEIASMRHELAEERLFIS
jgi:urease accessory protein